MKIAAAIVAMIVIAAATVIKINIFNSLAILEKITMFYINHHRPQGQG